VQNTREAPSITGTVINKPGVWVIFPVKQACEFTYEETYKVLKNVICDAITNSEAALQAALQEIDCRQGHTL